MITIDGSSGEGGGQILRTSLSLSMCCEKPVRLINIRSKRSNPGLMRQHLTCVKSAQEVCGATVNGDSLGSQVIEFIPGKIKAGHYRFSIRTAGSTSLVFQTILPALLKADNPSEVILEGGTHNSKAPSFDFLTLSFLPLLKKMGVYINTELLRYGFYPAGGGIWKAVIQPVKNWHKLNLGISKNFDKVYASVLLANLPEHIAHRELKKAKQLLQLNEINTEIKSVQAFGPGNVLSLRLQYDTHMEVFDGIGERKLSAEKVAKKAITQLVSFIDSKAIVGEHLTDQMLLPMALGNGGMFLTGPLSSHTTTNIEVISKLTGKQFHIEKTNNKQWLIELSDR